MSGTGQDHERRGGPAGGRYDVDRGRLAELLADQPDYRVDQVWDGLWRQARSPAEMTDLPTTVRDRLGAELPPALVQAARQTSDQGETVKWLWELSDGTRIETVLMHYDDRSTVCVSTQAGCAMGCGFCATGQAGFDRHLTAGEILEQVVRARREAGERRVSNVVFMGMGEPLANYDPTLAAVRRLTGDMGLSARHITVSTVGVVPGIERLADERLAVGLAVSLHAANDRLRDELVPVNRRYPLRELAGACHRHRRSRNRRLSLEWAMIDSTNDRPSDAAELATFAKPLRAHVNLIPLNPTPGYPTVGSPPDRITVFARWLEDAGVAATIRSNRGTDIDAACGQLRAGHDAVAVDPPVRTSTVRPDDVRTASTNRSPGPT